MKHVLGLFESEIEVIRQIEDLKVQGYDPAQMTAFTKDADFYLTIQHRTEATVETAGPTIKEKIKTIFTKKTPIKATLMNFGLSEADAEKYYRKIAEEKILLVTEEPLSGNNQTTFEPLFHEHPENKFH